MFANCLLALDANTGKRIWHFQEVKHDIWHRNFRPRLVSLLSSGMARRCMRCRKPRNEAGFTCSIG